MLLSIVDSTIDTVDSTIDTRPIDGIIDTIDSTIDTIDRTIDTCSLIAPLVTCLKLTFHFMQFLLACPWFSTVGVTGGDEGIHVVRGGGCCDLLVGGQREVGEDKDKISWRSWGRTARRATTLYGRSESPLGRDFALRCGQGGGSHCEREENMMSARGRMARQTRRRTSTRENVAMAADEDAAMAAGQGDATSLLEGEQNDVVASVRENVEARREGRRVRRGEGRHGACAVRLAEGHPPPPRRRRRSGVRWRGHRYASQDGLRDGRGGE